MKKSRKGITKRIISKNKRSKRSKSKRSKRGGNLMKQKDFSKMYKGMILLLDEDTYLSEKLVQRLSK